MRTVTVAQARREGDIAGYYRLATGQVDFGDLPLESAQRLPRQMLLVTILAWLFLSAKRLEVMMQER